MRFASATSVLVIALLAAACADDSQPAGGGGSGGSAGTAGGGNEAGGGGEGGQGGQPDCQAFIDNQPPVQTVEIEIRNASANPVYLGTTQQTCDLDPHYRVESLAGDPVKAFLTSCEHTCGDLAAGGCECPDFCAQPQVILIEPGGVFNAAWTQVVYEPAAMPQACYADEGCAGPTCLDLRIPGENLSFLVDGYGELGDCQTADCTCDPGVDGSCVVDGATLVSGAPTTASAEWVAGSGTLQVVFE